MKTETARPRRRRPSRVAGSGLGAGPLLALVVVAVVLYAPIAQLLVSSFNSNSLTASWKGFTTGWYRQAFEHSEVLSAAWRSAWLAALVALAAGVSGTAAVVGLRHHPRLRGLLSATAAARIATPELVLAVALGVVAPLAGLRLGILTMWLGHTVLFSAYVVVVVWSRLAESTVLLEETAADLGASPRRIVLRVVLPHALPAVIASMIMVAAFSFDDVLMSLRLGGPQDTTLPVVILSMSTRRPTPELDAIGSLVVAAGAVSFAVALLVSRWRRGSTRDVLGG